MAKLELHDPGDEKIQKTSLEVRVWGLGGTPDQTFDIGSGANFNGTANSWLEVVYTLHGVNLFYTRNFLHHYHQPLEKELTALEKFIAGESDRIGYGDMLPETGLSLVRKTHTYKDKTYTSYELEILLDTGAMFNHGAPGEECITFKLTHLPAEPVTSFMRDFILELDQANQGRYPDPGKLPAQSSDWPFALQLNQQAYNLVAPLYQERYFSHHELSQQFDHWLVGLHPGGKVLDAGCGHGDPVITRLLEGGFQVTGIDLSPEMLKQAQERFQNIPFHNLAVTQLEIESEFDGACSLSSMLYLDPIDFFHAIYRLYRALKPGGLLFLYAYDTHPGWRGHPFGQVLDQWMWSWTRSLDEAVHALEEHGYFSVLQAVELPSVIDDEPEEQVSPLAPLEELSEALEHLPSDAPPHKLYNFPEPKRTRPFDYTIIARRNEGG